MDYILVLFIVVLVVLVGILASTYREKEDFSSGFVTWDPARGEYVREANGVTSRGTNQDGPVDPNDGHKIQPVHPIHRNPDNDPIRGS